MSKHKNRRQSVIEKSGTRVLNAATPTAPTAAGESSRPGSLPSSAASTSLSLGQPVNAANLPFVGDFAALERLLPRLILLPQGSRKLSNNELKMTERCVRLAEAILALKPQVVHLDATANRAMFGQNGFDVNSRRMAIKDLVLEPGTNLEALSANDRRLAELKIRLSTRLEENIPNDIQEWIEIWDKKIDVLVGEQYLRWLADGSQNIVRQARDYLEFASRTQPAKFGLFARLRSLRWSKKYGRTQKNLVRLKNEIEFRKRTVKGKTEEAASLCGMLAAFLRLPLASAGANTRHVQKLVLLDLEREASEYLAAEISAGEQEYARLEQENARRQQLFATGCTRIAELEAQKNMRLISLYAESESNFAELIADSTVEKLCEAFADVEEIIEQELIQLDSSESRLARAQRELQRLTGVLDECIGNTGNAFGGSQSTYERKYERPTKATVRNTVTTSALGRGTKQ